MDVEAELLVNELFSGIGTQSLGLKYKNIKHKVVGIAEISKNAIKAYTALHGEVHNYGDISKVEKLNYADLWTYSFPCQDLSSGGKGKGIRATDENGEKITTRSGLLWEVERLLCRASGFDLIENKLVVNKGYNIEKPKYLLLENVPELITRKGHRLDFQSWLDRLDELGYNTSMAILNANDFGVPQNRERVFCLSVLRDIYDGDIDLPLNSPYEERIPINIRDFLDKSVLDYNGSLMVDPRISSYLLPAYTRDIEDIAYCAKMDNKPIWTCECNSGFQDHRVGIRWVPTIRHQNTHTAIFYNNQIHKLTACESWKFMGIKEKDFWKVKESTNLSDNILAGLAGNAIVVPILMSIFYQISLIEQRGYPETLARDEIPSKFTIKPKSNF